MEGARSGRADAYDGEIDGLGLGDRVGGVHTCSPRTAEYGLNIEGF